MTLQEFKAWFDGFTEGMPGTPNKDQWKRIKARVKEINGTAVTYPVFIDRYVHHYPSYPWSTFCVGSTIDQFQTTIGSANVNVRDDGHSVFNSSQAMLALGKADYQSIS